jgi:oligopeptide/dipeptide ABC transporter ATP-binding protein
VEEASVEDVYSHPRHPYTIGLLGSLPRLDEVGAKLFSIRGQPPDLISMPSGCPFLPRCEYAVERCEHELPPLEAVGVGHKAACWEKDKTEGVRSHGNR